MPATVIILPIVARPALHDPDWREQYSRECAARCEALHTPPPRTRPIKVIDNAQLQDQILRTIEFNALMRRLRGALNDEGNV